MLDWVSIRDPVARAAAKAAYCEEAPASRAGSTAGRDRPEARLLSLDRWARSITTGAMPAGAWRQWRPAPTANRSPIRWSHLSVMAGWCGSASTAFIP